ncbi:MAG TPA: PepSY-associated TM helix domain-containing protein [Opitutaceae bacterium]|nr:PepSY-associated TM helix domain-containing protein [Opitutaceae bacterium]
MSFRKIIFWAHLVAGVISGLAIGVMCFTGTVLAFEKEIVAWSERDARHVEPPAAPASRLSLDELQRRFREARPEARPATIVLQNDPTAAVAFSAGRTGGFYVNPYTGEARQPKSSAMGQFMQTMTAWHRYLGFSGEVSRPRGKWVNGVCNVAFCVLAVTGLYLWMPRSWSWRAIKPVIWFHQNAAGKARDFNWHNTIGFWSAPVLIVLTLTAIPISFQWGGRLINQLTGTPAPAAAARGAAGGGGGPGGAAPVVEVPAPEPGARPLSQDALLTQAQQQIPKWETITIRIGGPAGRGGAGGRGGEARPNSTAAATPATPASSATPSEISGEPATARRERSAPQAATFTVRESGTWPRTVTTTLSLNPYNGEVLRRTGYADMNATQQVRSWTRFLHTGEALGNGGQLVAGLACLGGCFLVYTGFALSLRRFFGKRTPEA